jgi:hypothetical protein
MSRLPTFVWVLLAIVLVLVMLYLLGVPLKIGG